MPYSRTALLLGLLALIPAAGCESKAGVSGTVTYKGEKLEQGYITFHPVTDSGETKGAKGETRGTAVIDGAYKIENLKPGKRKVVISATPKLMAVKGEGGAKPDVKAIPPANPIAVSAKGNGEVIEFQAGEQTRDFAIEAR